ncbi:hypothetical protein V9N58_003460 [Vibrio cholerae]
MNIDYTVSFHPVGQGLFCTGTVFMNRAPVFTFVYDCGTSSQQKLLDDAIDKLQFAHGIDLLTISHFDNDHISGLGRLLNKHKVKTLLLPALNLDERLYIAYSNGVGVSDNIISFYIDPVKYLLSKYDDRIDEIILVPSGKNKENEIDNRYGDEELHIDVESIDSDNPKVKILKVGGRLVYKSIFEFVPYNDSCVQTKINKSFCNSVKKESDVFLNSSGVNKVSGVNKIQAALARVRDSFDKNFGKSALKRNIISLYLFAGPCVSNTRYIGGVVFNENEYVVHHFSRDISTTADGVLFSGDGYLDSKKNLDSLMTFYGKDRMSRIACFQVMHHGARGCWHAGVAKALSPCFSVFSSDPDRAPLKHPHAEVVRDFLPCGPIQVDKKRHFTIDFFSC